MITHNGKIRIEGEWYSSYLLGYGNPEFVRRANVDLYPDYFCDQDLGRFHYKVVRRYINEEYIVLYKWLMETQTSFGGLLGKDMSINMLLVPDSIQEISFRLCFGVKELSL